MAWHNESRDDILKKLSADPAVGLTDDAAAALLTEHGENKLTGKPKKTTLQRFAEQFKDFMVIILLIAAAISFIVAFGGHDKTEFLEPIIILGIVLLNATLGVVQESKAEKALEALQDMSAPTAKVLRGGKVAILPSSQLVPGDVVLLEAGDFVPADARLLESASLKCEESALTGESVPSEKDANAAVDEKASLGDRSNMIYSGTSVVYGRARAVITSTGMDTEMGLIAKLLDNEADAQTPLQEKLSRLGKVLGVVALGVCAVIFVIGLVDKLPIMDIFMTSVSLAVAAIPEGLPAIVAIVLAMGVQRMVKKNAIIRRLPAVETLGSASVICSDKTGTLTQNRMTLVKAWANGPVCDINGSESERIKTLLTLATLCCDASIEVTNGKETYIGDPTEVAIVAAALKNGIEKSKLTTDCPRVAELPFDSDRKLMTTVNIINGKPIAIVKGAFDVLSSRLIDFNESEAVEVSTAMGKDALRVLAVAVKILDSVPQNPCVDELEYGLKFLGLVGMIDPPREEAKDAVAVCKKAGIRPIMITGDHVVTASAIARQLGILRDGDEALMGTALAAMPEEEFDKNITKYSVYARVTPEDKIRIVKAWQNTGAVVSMTGDGVNDAPALKAADIGCAMGITGTEVSKGAADMILTDDNFATIVQAVQEGRGIYDNIKKAVQFLLGSNIGELLTVFFAMIFWKQSPLLAIQLLWINLVTDGLPALALGMEPPEKDIMQRKPKPKSESIFAQGLGVRVVLQGFMFAALTLTAFNIGFTAGGVTAARTMAFLTLAVSQLFHAFNVRSTHSIFSVGLMSNPYMLGAFGVSFLLVAIIAFIPPIATVFGLQLLTAPLYLTALGLAFVPVVIIELEKLGRYLINRFKK
ncbi:MAG: cation-translocating P-type ATPase [Hydrogenoanaerobacterium sp.]